MNILDAQKDMRYGFFGGGVGMFVSGVVWLIAGIVALNGSANQAMWTLLIGGTLIFPVAAMLSKALGRPGKNAVGNPLVALALESNFWMVSSCFLAYTISQTNHLWFFPTMLLAVGGHYLAFSTLYGMRIYWLCGLLLTAAGVAMFMFNVPFHIQAFTGALIEIVIAPFVFMQGYKEEKPSF